MAELKRQGEKRQDRLHRQGFGNAAVNDLLEHIEDSFPQICEAANVDAIVTGIVYAGPTVKTVDVTDLLVKQYDPSEKTLRTVEELRKHPPIEWDKFPLDCGDGKTGQ